MVKISFTGSQAVYEVPSGTELLAAKRKHPEMPLKFGCTRGDCGVCVIEIETGVENLTKCSAKERETLNRKKKGNNFRLACQCALNGNIKINT
jgi:ferredoxin